MNDPIFMQMAANLAEVATRNGASIISDKIRLAKTKKESKETISELEEIIYNLLEDKAEIKRIAQKITEDDSKYITDNLLPIFKDFIPDQVQLEQLEKILSVETLTILQLIGFNYKQAIGDPLTLLIQKTIESKIPTDSKINAEYVLAMANLALDENATNRYFKLTGQSITSDDK